MFLGEKDIKMMVRSKINIRMFITFEIKSQLHDKNHFKVRRTASLNVDTGNLFDDIVDSRHSEADFFSSHIYLL
jgi:hypothetical protein